MLLNINIMIILIHIFMEANLFHIESDAPIWALLGVIIGG